MPKQYAILVILILLLLPVRAMSQENVMIKGVLYSREDATIDSVVIKTSSGFISRPNSVGAFEVPMHPYNDVVRFYLNQVEIGRYAFVSVPYKKIFILCVEDMVFQDTTAHALAGVTVYTRNYTKDSLQDREEFAKIFDYNKPGVKLSPEGLIGSVIAVLQVKKNNRRQHWKDMAIQTEQDKYIDRRFTTSLVAGYTAIKGGDKLDSFVLHHRPAYANLVAMNDLLLGQYILDCYKKDTAYNK